jgi:hypothetical protein
VRTPGRDGVDPNANVEILTQKGANEIEKKVIDAGGNETVTTQEGQLENTQVNRPMPEALAAPETKPGLPTRDERVAEVTPAAGPTTTADAAAPTTAPLGDPTTTIAVPPATAPAGNGNLPPLRPIATVPGG